MTQRAIKEGQKRGHERIEIIVASLNDYPDNLKCLQPLVAAAEAGVRKEQVSSEIEGKAPFQTEVYESPDATLDLLNLKGNSDNRLILISNGKGVGTQQMVHHAESLGVKVIGYNPETKKYIGAPSLAVPTPTKSAKVAKDSAR
ncbi:hypothetical protein H6F76_05630 [Leptolyngbya sp. FACHB-321]|uniref:hypothetical protein n=1 Tax=Leptolyngbya sp. FACHB-321 TaxID=2692807 RepID=UPI001688A2C7|nr:hypothetical protein [Leptolyngbya sp. FACHB-321]MBD2034513.1 hypothetical protein [Leptolyngbya sp. FACHB-321]